MLKLVTGSLCLAALLAAAVVIRFSVEDLIDNSEWIVEGRVLRSYSAWDAKHTMIWTHYDVQVSDTLRGTPQSSVTVSEPGGVMDGLGMTGSGTVPYTVGEHVVLFLYRTPIGYLRTAGAGQGKFTVGPDGRARAALQGLAFSGDAHGTAIGSIDALPLNDLKQRVRRLAAIRPAHGVAK